jgi:hypothetical protein
VIRRGAATSAVKTIAEFGQDNPETDGNEIDTNILAAFVECSPACLRKFDSTGLSAFRAVEGFGPMVPPGHSPNMRLSQSRSSRYPCHNPKSTDGRSRPRPHPAGGLALAPIGERTAAAVTATGVGNTSHNHEEAANRGGLEERRAAALFYETRSLASRLSNEGGHP